MTTGTVIHIPAREGRATRVPAGGRFQVIDVEGKQCADLFVFNAADISEYLSTEHSKVHVNRIFPKPGEHFVTNRRRPIVFFEEDHTPGKHDAQIAACDPTRYEGLGVKGWHASCQENLQIQMKALGHDVEIPAPVNLFTNVPIGPDGTLGWEPALTAPGDYVTLRAEMDVLVCVSACPQDIMAINDRHITDLELRLL